MAHHEIVFPNFESWQHEGGAGFETALLRMKSGLVRANQDHQNAARQYTVMMDRKKLAQITEVMNFYLARSGVANTFNYLDPRDHHTKDWSALLLGTEDVDPDDQVIGAGDGATLTFQLVKRYQDAAASHVRTLRKIVAGTVRVAIDGVEKTEGVDFTVNVTTGIITFSVAPANLSVITAGCQFYTPVRFSEEIDELFTARLGSPDMAAIPTVPLVEELYPTSALEDVYRGGSKTLIAGASVVLTLDLSAVFWNILGSPSKLLLPNIADTPDGGPIFQINKNAGPVPTIKTHDDATLIYTFGAGDESRQLWVGYDIAGARQWYVY